MTKDIRVLLVDDEPDFLSLTAEYLKREADSLAIETATSGSEALDVLAETDIDCVVSDYNMPGLDGIELFESVRDEYSDIPFILFTGRGSEEVASQAISTGVTDYLQKGGTEKFSLLANRIEITTDRKDQVQELERLQDLFHQALSETETYVWDWDLETGEIERYPNVEPLFGVSSEDIGGVFEERGFTDHIHPDDQARVRQTMEQSIESGTGYQFQCRFETADGSWRWIRDRGVVLTEEGEAIRAIGSVTDITQQVTQARKLEVLFEDAADPIVDITFEDPTPIIQRVNPAFEAMFGVDADGVVGEPLNEVVVPEGERERAAAFDQRLKSGEIVKEEFQRQTEDGLRWFLLRTVAYTLAGEPRAYAAYIDISERKRQQERFQAFLKQSTDITSVLDEGGTYKYQSPAAERITGYDPDEMIGDRAFDYVHPDDREQVMEKFAEAVPNPEMVPSVEYRFKHHDGSWIWLESLGNNQLDNPAIEGFVVNSRDITDRVEREQRLERERNRLDRFASVVSHDLRNPLNVAKGRLELAREEWESAHLDAAANAHERMETLIDDLLTLARHGQPVDDVESVNLAEVVESCWETVLTDEATIRLETDRTVRADRNRLQQLLENLFRNAVEHGGSDVTVTVGGLPDGFSVGDDGPGISEGERANIFDLGYTTAEAGTGFGLSIVKEITDAHGWDITITESESGGARFEVTDVEIVE